VAYCIAKGLTLETLPLAAYRTFDPRFGEDVFEAIRLENCLALRKSAGGPAKESVLGQVEEMRAWLEG